MEAYWPDALYSGQVSVPSLSASALVCLAKYVSFHSSASASEFVGSLGCIPG